ncbi:hypothetical protein [Sphingomonas daechungensis]|nr:hypothetical protein [Sphingomonas daechungensis]
MSWPMVGLAAALGAIMLWLTDFSRPWHLLERAHVSFALLGLIALSLVKIFDRRR